MLVTDQPTEADFVRFRQVKVKQRSIFFFVLGFMCACAGMLVLT